MSTGMEHSGECSHGRSNEAVSNMISPPCLILDVENELLQVGGPLMMVVILQFFLCLHELQRIMVNVDDYLLPKNVMSPLKAGLHNGLHFIVISRVLTDNI